MTLKLVGSTIGQEGDAIKQLEAESEACIKIAEAVPNCEERGVSVRLNGAVHRSVQQRRMSDYQGRSLGQYDTTFETSLKRRIPFGEDESKARRVCLFMTNSAMNLSMAVVTSGVSAQASRQRQITGKCLGYSQSKTKPVEDSSNTVTSLGKDFDARTFLMNRRCN